MSLVCECVTVQPKHTGYPNIQLTGEDYSAAHASILYKPYTLHTHTHTHTHTHHTLTPTHTHTHTGGGEKGWDAVEESWVVEHAKEVQRMSRGVTN